LRSYDPTTTPSSLRIMSTSSLRQPVPVVGADRARATYGASQGLSWRHESSDCTVRTSYLGALRPIGPSFETPVAGMRGTRPVAWYRPIQGRRRPRRHRPASPPFAGLRRFQCRACALALRAVELICWEAHLAAGRHGCRCIIDGVDWDLRCAARLAVRVP